MIVVGWHCNRFPKYIWPFLINKIAFQVGPRSTTYRVNEVEILNNNHTMAALSVSRLRPRYEGMTRRDTYEVEYVGLTCPSSSVV